MVLGLLLCDTMRRMWNEARLQTVKVGMMSRDKVWGFTVADYDISWQLAFPSHSSCVDKAKKVKFLPDSFHLCFRTGCVLGICVSRAGLFVAATSPKVRTMA